MVSMEGYRSHSHSDTDVRRACYYYTPPPLPAKISRSLGRSMRTIRSNLFRADQSESSPNMLENLTDSIIDGRLGELANRPSGYSKSLSSSDIDDFLDIPRAFSDYSACSSDISGELQRLASPTHQSLNQSPNSVLEPETCYGYLFSTEIIEDVSPEDLRPTVELCVVGLQSSSVAVKRSAAAKLRLLAKNQADNRALIGESGAVPAFIPLLHCSDSMTQEHAVTALLNLSLHENNKSLIIDAGAIKSLIYVLETGTETSKQNAACALLNLALIEENQLFIGGSGAIPPLVALLMNGSDRGKKDALATLYKLCSARLNKERALGAGVVRPLVALVGEHGAGLPEKAMAVLSGLAQIEMGREAIVDEGGIAALAEAIEDASDKGKDIALLILLKLCGESVRNRGLLVGAGCIPSLVAISQVGKAKARHKAGKLLGYLREARWEASSSSS